MAFAFCVWISHLTPGDGTAEICPLSEFASCHSEYRRSEPERSGSKVPLAKPLSAARQSGTSRSRELYHRERARQLGSGTAARAPHDLCFLTGYRGGCVVGGTTKPSPSTDRQYRDFNMVFLYKAGTYATGIRCLRAGTRYRVTRGELFGTGTYDRSLLPYISVLLYKWSGQGVGGPWRLG